MYLKSWGWRVDNHNPKKKNQQGRGIVRINTPIKYSMTFLPLGFHFPSLSGLRLLCSMKKTNNDERVPWLCLESMYLMCFLNTYCSCVRTRFICKSGFKGGNNFGESVIVFLVGGDNQALTSPSYSLFPNTAYDCASCRLRFRTWQVTMRPRALFVWCHSVCFIVYATFCIVSGIRHICDLILGSCTILF